MNERCALVYAVAFSSFFFFIGTFIAFPVFAQERRVTEEQFLKEAPQRWLEYLHKLNDKEAHVTRLVVFSDGTETIKQDYTFQFSYPCLCTLFHDHNIESYRNRLVCVGRKYGFELKRENENMDWSIDRYAPLEGDSLIVGSRESTREFRFPPVFNRQDVPRDHVSGAIVADLAPGLYFSGTRFSLYNFFTDDKIKILDFEDVSSEYGAIPAVRVSFEYQWNTLYDGLDEYHSNLTRSAVEEAPERAASWKPLRVTGDALFISRYYLVSKGNFHYEYADETEDFDLKVDYRDLDSFPLPTMSTYKGVSNGFDDSYETNGEVTLDIHDRADKSDAPFRLSGYGFPEPDIDQDSTILLRRVFLCGIGVLCVAIGVWIAHKRFKEDKQGA